MTIPAIEIGPAPTDDELVAIVAAVELAWPRPVIVTAALLPKLTATNWRFSGRWWNDQPLVSRPRP